MSYTVCIKTIDQVGQYFATHLARLPNGGRDQRNANYTQGKEKRKGGHKDKSCPCKARRAGQFNENYGHKAGKSYNKLHPKVWAVYLMIAKRKLMPQHKSSGMLNYQAI